MAVAEDVVRAAVLISAEEAVPFAAPRCAGRLLAAVAKVR